MKASATVNIEEYLSPDFRPEVVANRLIRETTTARDTNVDTNPALTKLQYDIDEIDNRMETLCQDNTEALLAHALRTTKIAEEVERLRPVIEDVNTAVSKLDRDFVGPFNEASDLHSTGEKMHELAVLVRSLNWYLQLALQAQSEDYKRENLPSIEGPAAAMLRNAHAIKTMSKLVTDIPKLSKLTAVDQFSKQIPHIKTSINEAATELIKTTNSNSPNQIRMALLTLVILGADVEKIVDLHFRALVGNTVLQLTRGAGTNIDYELAFSEAHKRAENIGTLLAIKTDIQQKIVTGSSLEEIKVKAVPHTQKFWDTLATQIDQKLRVLSVTNQTAMKSLIASHDAILTNTKSLPKMTAVFSKYINK